MACLNNNDIDKKLRLIRENAQLMTKMSLICYENKNFRSLQLELVNLLLLNLMDGDTDFDALKTKLNSFFWPKDLKEIMVDASQLEETIGWGSIFGIGLHTLMELAIPPHDNVDTLSIFITTIESTENGNTHPDIVKPDAGVATLSERSLLPISSDEGYLRKGKRIKVQIKEARKDEDKASIIQEAKLLSQLRHENIIKILAFDKSGPRMALEYMSLDTLWNALETYRFSGTKLLSILKEVTAGMSYLAEKKYVLRNLCSENILLDSSGSCKISNLEYCQYVGDSGGTYIDEGSSVEITLAAPEVKDEHKFSTKSDVWDMGLLGWEVFTVEPDQTMSGFMSGILKKCCFLKIFIDKHVLPRPSKCPFPLWLFIQHRLLSRDPAVRPTFPEVMNELKKFDNWRFTPGYF